MAAVTENHQVLNGVRTWWRELGAGDPVVLLHGALTDSRVFGGNLDALADRFRLYLPERRGHGHTPDAAGPISPSVMAQDTIAFLREVVGRPAYVVGYSAGAVVAMVAAARHPALFARLVLISGAFHREGWLLPPASPQEVPPEIAQSYAEVSPDGAQHFPVVVEKIAASSADEPALTAEQLRHIGCRTLVMAGDDDAVSLEHVVALYRALPRAELAIVPGASHCVLLEKPALCTQLVAHFLTADAVPTLMPLRPDRRALPTS